MMGETLFAPASPKQEAFIAAAADDREDSADIILFGGAAFSY